MPMKKRGVHPPIPVYYSVIVPNVRKPRPRMGCDFQAGWAGWARLPLFSPSRKNRREEVRKRGMGQKKGKCSEHCTL